MTLQQAIAGATPADWAKQFLAGVGAPATATNIDTITRWMNVESGGYNPGSSGGRYNPLNIVATSGDGHSGQGGSQGNIADFPDLQTGVHATVAFFSPKGGNKQAIVDALKRSDQAATVAAINAFYASWGGSFSLGGSPAETTAAGAGTTTAGGSGSADAGGCPQLFGFTLPGLIGGSTIGLNRCQGRALLGGVAIAGGVLVLVLAVQIMAKDSVPLPIPGMVGKVLA